MSYYYGGLCRPWGYGSCYDPCDYGYGCGGWYGSRYGASRCYEPCGYGYGYGCYGGLGNWCGSRWSYPYSRWGCGW